MNESSLLHNLDLCSNYIQHHPSHKNIGLVSGETALLLCFYYLYKRTKQYKYKKHMLKLAEEQLEGINSTFNLNSGLSALCLVLYWIKQDCLIKEQMEEIDLLIEKECNLSLNKNDMDYFHGASGYIFYFLMTNKYKQLDALISKYNQQVYNNFNNNDWYTLFYQKENIPAMVINMGTPHGITGILLTLLIVLEKGYQSVTPTITKVCDFLLNSRFCEIRKSVFPSVIKQNGEKIDSGIAWCYGDLMASYAILKAGTLLKDSHYTEIGYQLLLQLDTRTDYLKNDLCLCHGHSSLVVIYKNIYKITDDKLFWEKYIFWQRKTSMLFEAKMKSYKQEEIRETFFENPSLFAGFPGLILSLLTWKIKDCEWEKCLLL